jgi:hypothetical protein
MAIESVAHRTSGGSVKSAQVTLLDLGLSDSFNTSMKFVDYLLGALNVRDGHPYADVNFVRSRDLGTVRCALYAPSEVVHVMAHGDAVGEPAFVDDTGTTWLFPDLDAEYDLGRFAATTILADACRTGTQRWKRAIRGLLATPTTYIGSRANVTWLDSTVFSSNFYSAMFRSRGKGTDPLERAVDAATRANQAYESVLGRPSPYTVEILKPMPRRRRVA